MARGPRKHLARARPARRPPRRRHAAQNVPLATRRLPSSYRKQSRLRGRFPAGPGSLSAAADGQRSETPPQTPRAAPVTANAANANGAPRFGQAVQRSAGEETAARLAPAPRAPAATGYVALTAAPGPEPRSKGRPWHHRFPPPRPHWRDTRRSLRRRPREPGAGLCAVIINVRLEKVKCWLFKT